MLMTNAKISGKAHGRQQRKPAWKAKSVAEFIGCVSEIDRIWTTKGKDPPDLWFRGHEINNWQLKPLLYRAREDEGELRVEFKRRARLFLNGIEPRNEWEWYFLMRHHGMPTRLLDWTDGALLALYFAVRNKKSETEAESNNDPKDAAVWVLDPAWLNAKSKSLKRWYIAIPEAEEVQRWLPEDPYARRGLLLPNPVAIDPPHFLARISAQRSHFTLFGRKKNGLLSLANNDSKRRIEKIEIVGESVSKIRDDLEISGVTETSVFPDLDALVRELTD